MEYTQHPISASWPRLTSDEWRHLTDSIESFGCIDNILADAQGRIYDGWHRYRACLHAGVDPPVVVSDRSMLDIARLVIGRHRGRRHLGIKAAMDATVATMRLGGLPYAEPGRPRETEKNNQVPDPTTINYESVKTLAGGGSKSTYDRAIQDRKRAEGLLPPQSQPTRTPTPKPTTGDAREQELALLDSALDASRDEVQELQATIESLRERIAILQESMTNDQAEIAHALELERQRAETYWAQMTHWMGEARRWQQYAQHLKRETDDRQPEQPMMF